MVKGKKKNSYRKKEKKEKLNARHFCDLKKRKLVYFSQVSAQTVQPTTLEYYQPCASGQAVGDAASINVVNRALREQCNNSEEDEYLILTEACVRSLRRKHDNSQLRRQLHVQRGPMVLLLGQRQPERRLRQLPGILHRQHLSQ